MASKDRKQITRRNFSGSPGRLLAVSIFLTGIYSLSGLYFVIHGLSSQYWKRIGVSTFLGRVMIYMCISFCLVSLVKIAIDERPFSKMLVHSMKSMGAVIVLASVIFPRLPDYKTSGFELLSSGTFVLIDGSFLMVGVLIMFFGCLMKEGLLLQEKEDIPK